MPKHISEQNDRFNHLTSEIYSLYHEAALSVGLSDSELMVLYTVITHGDDCPLRDIVKLSGWPKQTVNSTIRKMEREGSIYLKALDGKNKLVCLTPSGRILAEGTALPIISIENDIFDSWTPYESEEYLRLTQKYLNDFREKIKIL